MNRPRALRTLLTNRRTAWRFALVLTSLGLLVGVFGFHSGAVRWRARLIAMKVSGELAGATWSEVLRIVAGSETHPIAPLLREGSLFRVARNPHTTPADVEIGRRIFQTSCVACHGADARGLSGPDLTRSGRAGASSWALYLAIREGVTGTEMRGFPFSDDSIWRVVSYVESLRGSAPEPAAKPPAAPASAVTYERLLNASAEAGNWLTYSGGYDALRHSPLAKIDRNNAGRLRLRWLFQLPTAMKRIEATPLVVDGVMFMSEPEGVVALDARNGGRFWTYRRSLPRDVRVCCGPANRGVAVLGKRVFLGTLDAHLIALDAATGEPLWDVEVADYRMGYSINAAPLAIKDKIVIGVAGADYGARGFIDGYFAETGERAWRFHAVPEPGEPGHETWSGDSWKTGGASTWLTGSFDPELNLVYWGVGNPSPLFEGEGRKGDNLYSNSVVALDADSGSLRWHFQFTPHDEHDWDATQIPVLVNAEDRGASRRLMLWANRNAFFYVLDRETGEFQFAREFAKQTWAEGLDASGKPIRRAGAEPSPGGTLVSPAVFGATNWWSPSYSPRTGLFYVPTIPESASMYFSGPADFEPGKEFTGSAVQGGFVSVEPAVRALDPLSGAIRWEYVFPRSDVGFSGMGGIVSTAGDLVLTGTGNFFVALDAATGTELWRFNVGGAVVAGPISYRAGGDQFVSVAAGRSILAFALDEN